MSMFDRNVEVTIYEEWVEGLLAARTACVPPDHFEYGKWRATVYVPVCNEFRLVIRSYLAAHELRNPRRRYIAVLGDLTVVGQTREMS